MIRLNYPYYIAWVADRGTFLTTNERRQRHRFPLALRLRYHASSPASPSLTGTRHMENISRCGLLFRCVGNLELGSHIALEVDLARKPSGEQLKLYASGFVTRSDPSAVAVAFGQCKLSLLSRRGGRSPAAKPVSINLGRYRIQ